MKTTLACLLLLSLSASSQDSFESPRWLSVTGWGYVEARPDQATVTFGVETTAYDAATAVENAADAMEAATRAAVRAGVDEDAIVTTYYSLWTEEEYDPDTYDYTGVMLNHVSQTVAAEVRDLDDIGDVIAAVVSAGANSVSGVTFQVDDLEALKEEARVEAARDARRRAEQLATALGLSLGEITSVSEYDYGYDNYYYDSGYSASSVSMYPAGGGEMAAPSIMPDMLKISSSVSVTFEIR